MKTNLGMYDKLIRLIVSMVLIVLYYMEVLKGTLGIIALLVAFVLTLTTLVGFCPIYALLGISTCKGKKKKA